VSCRCESHLDGAKNFLTGGLIIDVLQVEMNKMESPREKQAVLLSQNQDDTGDWLTFIVQSPSHFFSFFAGL
jgi:hypothetical protein